LSDLAPRLAPRSAVAAADFELLRVARTEVEDGETDASVSLADRLRVLATFLPSRPSEDGTVVRLGRTED